MRNKAVWGIHGGFSAMSTGNRGVGFAIGLVAGASLALLFLVWSFPGFRNPVYQDERYSHAQNQETGENNPVVRPSFWETYTKPADTYAQWAMVILALAATGVSIVALKVLRNTFDQQRIATEAAVSANEIMQDDKRAWIDFVLEPNGPSGHRNETAFCEFSSVIKNVGDRPATGVIHHIKLVSLSLRDAYRDAVQNYVADIFERKAHMEPGSTVFPSNKTKNSHKQYSLVGPVGRTDEGDFDVYLLSCVTYRANGSNRYRHTARIYGFDRNTDAAIANLHGWRLVKLSKTESIE